MSAWTTIKAAAPRFPLLLNSVTVLATMTDLLTFPDTDTKGTSRDSLSKVESSEDGKNLEERIMLVLYSQVSLR